MPCGSVIGYGMNMQAFLSVSQMVSYDTLTQEISRWQRRAYQAQTSRLRRTASAPLTDLRTSLGQWSCLAMHRLRVNTSSPHGSRHFLSALTGHPCKLPATCALPASVKDTFKYDPLSSRNPVDSIGRRELLRQTVGGPPRHGHCPAAGRRGERLPVDQGVLGQLQPGLRDAQVLLHRGCQPARGPAARRRTHVRRGKRPKLEWSRPAVVGRHACGASLFLFRRINCLVFEGKSNSNECKALQPVRLTLQRLQAAAGVALVSVLVTKYPDVIGLPSNVAKCLVT